MVDILGRQGGRYPGLIGQSHYRVAAISQRLWLWERETHALSKGVILTLAMLLVGVVGFELLSLVYYGPGSANLAPDITDISNVPALRQ